MHQYVRNGGHERWAVPGARGPSERSLSGKKEEEEKEEEKATE